MIGQTILIVYEEINSNNNNNTEEKSTKIIIIYPPNLSDWSNNPLKPVEPKVSTEDFK